MGTNSEYNRSLREQKRKKLHDLEKNLPGPILSNLSMLIDFICNPYVVNNNFGYNDFFDKYASERICKALKIEL